MAVSFKFLPVYLGQLVYGKVSDLCTVIFNILYLTDLIGAAWVYPILLSYASAALVTTITVVVTTITMPASHDKTIDDVSKFYSLSNEGRITILGPVIPFLVIPAIMWVDMFMKTSKLVIAGAKATSNVTHKKLD